MQQHTGGSGSSSNRITRSTSSISNRGVGLLSPVAIRSVNLKVCNADVNDGVPASLLRELSLLQLLQRQHAFAAVANVVAVYSGSNIFHGKGDRLFHCQYYRKKQQQLQQQQQQHQHQKQEQQQLQQELPIVRYVGAELKDGVLHVCTEFHRRNLKSFWRVSRPQTLNPKP